MSRVMVTGATTPLGRALVESLLDDERVERVLAVGRAPFGCDGPAGPHPKLACAEAELSRARSLRELMFRTARDERVDTVVHAAAHRSARDEGDRVHAQNVDATRELLRLCARHPTVRRFVLRSHAEVYQVRADEPSVLSEDRPLELSPRAPQWVRDRTEADLVACTQVGILPLGVAVLRLAECFAPASGSQLYDYLSSPWGLRPMGFDPMLNLLSLPDAARALHLAALATDAVGAINVPGADTLPLSEAAALWGQRSVPVPSVLLGPWYRARAAMRDTEFRYDLNHWRLHFGAVLDGRRARQALGYEPAVRIDWRAARHDAGDLHPAG